MHSPQTSVRVEQTRVLAALLGAGRPLTPEDIAFQLNASPGPTDPMVLPLDVECTLAALLLRPDLRNVIAARVRRATRAERRARRALPFGALSSVVILAACSTLSPDPSGKRVTVASYFGHGPHPKIEYADSRALFIPPTAALSCEDVPCINAPHVDEVVAVKTPAEAPASLLAYFAEGDARSYPPRPETELALSDNPTAPSDTTPAPLALQHAASVEISPPPITLAAALPDGPAIKRYRLEAKPHPFGPQPLNKIKLSAPAPESLSAAPIHPDQAKHAPAAAAATNVAELISFGNNSDVLDAAALTQLQPLAHAARLADGVRLRGRVGYAVLTDAQRRLAVGRAIAVRRALVELGVERSKIKILIPRDHDFVDAADPAAPVNRSVSVALTLSAEKAALLRQADSQKLALF